MLEDLERVVGEIGNLNCKLVLLVGPPRSGKSLLLNALAERKDATVIRLGTDLGRRLVPVPRTRRSLQASEILGELTHRAPSADIIFFDNIELLFDRTLQLDPLNLLKRHAHAQRAVAVWPGEFHDGRLTYATIGHPEYQDYGVDGLVPFRVY